MEFSVVILNDNVSSYQGIDWVDWKDENRKKMKSQGDNWSKATLSGTDIWNCLDSHEIDRRHLVQWKPIGDALHQVSLHSHPHPLDQTSWTKCLRAVVKTITIISPRLNRCSLKNLSAATQQGSRTSKTSSWKWGANHVLLQCSRKHNSNSELPARSWRWLRMHSRSITKASSKGKI